MADYKGYANSPDIKLSLYDYTDHGEDKVGVEIRGKVNGQEAAIVVGPEGETIDPLGKQPQSNAKALIDAAEGMCRSDSPNTMEKNMLCNSLKIKPHGPAVR